MDLLRKPGEDGAVEKWHGYLERTKVCLSIINCSSASDRHSHFRIPFVDEILLPYSLILSSLCTKTNRLSPNLFL